MLCPGCKYPIPSWQHNGACKPVEAKVPPIQSVTPTVTPTVTQPSSVTPPVTQEKKRYATAAERQRAYRERKKQ